MTEQQPMQPEDRAELHRKILAANEIRSREQLAEANRGRGVAAPRAGDKLFVSTTRDIPRRNRAGLRFSRTSKTEVTVTDLGPAELAAEQLVGKSVVSVHGAEEILADTSLLVHTTGGAIAEDLASATARAEQLESDNAQLRAELAAARRQAPPDPGDGSSSRLKAAAKARDSGDFGHGNTK